MSPVKEPDTRLWRKEHGVGAKPEAILVYSTSPLALNKLRGVLHFYGLFCTEPLPRTALVAAEANQLTQVINQWRDTLTPEEFTEVRGGLLETRTPTPEDLSRTMLNLFDLDQTLAKMKTRWLVRMLAADSFFVMFQPLYSVAQRRTLAFECLLRGDQDGTAVGVDKLLQSAQVLGMSHELDLAAWRAAYKQGRPVVEQGHLLFLNFTPSSMFKPKFAVSETKALAEESGVPFHSLVFEVTEAEKVRDLENLKNIMNEYRAAGAKVALDDLGSGYSSILHLADLRPDFVKLDQGLVRGAYKDQVRGVLLKAIADAAHELGIQVVAEGVETFDDLKFCIDIRADLVQGYYVAKPAEAPPAVSEEMLQKLTEWTPAS
jgi:EAL domain-containing protein (putative c-di-GMP-specific phosphodiesterase class I)